MDSETPHCGYLDCGKDAVGSRAVRGTVWFASHSRLNPANGEETHWELGGYIEPVAITMSIHVCEEHNAVTQEVENLDLG